MPWQDNSGGNNPWGGRPGGNGRGPGQPPNFDDLIRRGQRRLKDWLPGGGSGRTFGIIAVIIIVVWMLSGFYRVEPDEQGVVLRFGEWVNTTQPGLHYHLPVPIERVHTPKVTAENKIEIGFRSLGAEGDQIRDISQESLMLTGDENIVDIDFVINWIIKDAGQYLFKIQNPEDTVKAVAESAMREIIGKTDIQSALTEGRQAIESQTRELMQATLDDYQSGVQVTRVQMQKSDPPDSVIDAFRDVQAARADMERLRNEAETYRNNIIPRARGESEQIVRDAEGYKEQVIAQANGEAARFISVYDEYAKSRDITKQRIYLETMEQILERMDKIIIDESAGSGVVPYLPLPELRRRQQGGDQ